MLSCEAISRSGERLGCGTAEAATVPPAPAGPASLCTSAPSQRGAFAVPLPDSRLHANAGSSLARCVAAPSGSCIHAAGLLLATLMCGFLWAAFRRLAGCGGADEARRSPMPAAACSSWHDGLLSLSRGSGCRLLGGSCICICGGRSPLAALPCCTGRPPLGSPLSPGAGSSSADASTSPRDEEAAAPAAACSPSAAGAAAAVRAASSPCAAGSSPLLAAAAECGRIGRAVARAAAFRVSEVRRA